MPKKVSNNKSIEKVMYENSVKNEHIKAEFQTQTTNYRQEDTKKSDISNLVNGMSNVDKKKVLRHIQFRKAKDNYVDYLRLCFPHYIWTPFHVFLAKICQSVVEKIENGEKVRVLLSVPPRHGKSETVTKTLPSWFIGRNPDKNAILTAYNADLAEKFNDANRQKTREFGKDIFGIEISESQDNKALYQIKGHMGGSMGVGFMGGITGNGGELIIIDDPTKNGEEANSETQRERLYQTYRDSIYTRLQGKGNGLIVIQTRWHEDDLLGRLMKQSGWYVINIPCVCDNTHDIHLHRQIGETLCPQLGFDAKWAEETKQNVGLKVWEALYQGHPTIDGGDIFTRKMIKQYSKAQLPNDFDEITMSCDLSFGGKEKQNDPCAIQVWGRVGANHYLLKRIKKRLTFNEMCDTIKIVSATYPKCRRKLVEKKANGQAVIDTLNNVIGGFVAYDPKMTDKVSRANSSSHYLESGNVWLPDSTIDNTIDEMIDELMKFPNGSHDDEVDAMTQYLCSYEYKYGGKIDTNSSFVDFVNAIRGF